MISTDDPAEHYSALTFRQFNTRGPAEFWRDFGDRLSLAHVL